jgi:putative membrane protein
MLTDKLLTLAFGLLFLLTIACGDTVETEKSDAVSPPVVKEMSRSAAFVDYAASTNMLQAELARLAIEQGQSEQVRAMAAQMLAFYEDALASLRQVATAEGLHSSLPDSLGSADQAIIAEFRKLPAAEFDGRYRQYINSSYKSQQEHYQQMLERTEEEEIRKWISEMKLQLQARRQLIARHDSAALQ